MILNIEEDHLDFFKDLEDIRNSFHKFAKLLPADGCLIINGAIDRLQEITGDLDCRVITFNKEAVNSPLPIIIPRILLMTSSVILPLRFTGMGKCPAVFLCRFPESITYAMPLLPLPWPIC